MTGIATSTSKTLISILAIIVGSVGIMSCNQPQNHAVETAQANPLVIGQKNSQTSSDSQTLTNGEWTITIGNANSWSGVNGTGNLSYRGCDSKGNCISLTGGRITCRNGICATVWRNGEYSYVIEEPMGNPDRPAAPGSLTTLTVRKGSKVILKAKGFKVVSPARSSQSNGFSKS